MNNKIDSENNYLDSKTEKKTRILIVDDQKPLLRLISRLFENDETDVVCCENAQDAIDAIQKSMEEFDLAILDVMMPGMSGYELCRKLRQTYSLYELPVVFITANVETEQLMEGFDAGANDFIRKPFESRELIARCDALIRMKKLTKANELLQSAIDMKNQFIQMNIHDLKNPLTSILLNSEMLQNEILAKSDAQFNIKIIYESATNMIRMIDQVLEMSKIELGKISIQNTQTNLLDLINNVISSNSLQAERKNQKLLIETDSALTDDFIIYADPEKSFRIFDNVINNAIKYSPKSKDIIVRLSSSSKNSRKTVITEVRDQGPGLDNDEKYAIFDKFSSKPNRPTDGESSSGLGLSITKELVSLQKGLIWVESERGKGSSFFIELSKDNE